jgi:hypothetical protein
VEEALPFFAVAVEQEEKMDQAHKELQILFYMQDIFYLLSRSLDQYRIDETISHSNQEKKVEHHLLLGPTQGRCNIYLELT